LHKKCKDKFINVRLLNIIREEDKMKKIYPILIVGILVLSGVGAFGIPIENSVANVSEPKPELNVEVKGGFGITLTIENIGDVDAISPSKISVTDGECHLRIEAYPDHPYRPRFTGKPIDFDVDVQNDGPNDCYYYEVTLSIWEGWNNPVLLTDFDPIIFDDPDNPLKVHEYKHWDNVRSWTFTEKGFYKIKAIVTNEFGSDEVWYDFTVLKTKSVTHLYSSPLFIKVLERLGLLLK